MSEARLFNLSPAQKLALRFAHEHGGRISPTLVNPSARDALERKFLIEDGVLTDLGRRMVDEAMVEFVHACVHCKSGAVETMYTIPQGTEVCGRCRRAHPPRHEKASTGPVAQDRGYHGERRETSA